jgi:glycosyltransferase involved in cell wall biosynthesis
MSRVDYEWKGHDRLLRALARLSREDVASNIHIIFSGWGQDFDKARRFIHEHRLADRITFLDCALSKPLLYRFYLNADFVIDQFIVGMCGTSALEAMSCGSPLVTWINTAVERPWGVPPVLQAKTEEEIAAVLTDISRDRIDLQSVGTQLQEWIRLNYDPATTAADLLSTFAGAGIAASTSGPTASCKYLC